MFLKVKYACPLPVLVLTLARAETLHNLSSLLEAPEAALGYAETKEVTLHGRRSWHGPATVQESRGKAAPKKVIYFDPAKTVKGNISLPSGLDHMVDHGAKRCLLCS